MTLPMSWDGWAQHDGTALAARVRKGEVKSAELAAQAVAGIAWQTARLRPESEVGLPIWWSCRRRWQSLGGADSRRGGRPSGQPAVRRLLPLSLTFDHRV